MQTARAMTAPAGPPVLEVENLQVAFGALIALDAVSWTVRAGEILGLIGPNGAGKSTCYNAATHMVRRSGRVVLKGEDITSLPASGLAARGLRRAFQLNSFFTDLTVLENMVAVLQDRYGTGFFETLVLPLRERRRRAEAYKAARAILTDMAVPAEFHDRYPGELPYGLQRMLSIALAHGAGAEVLLLDEPAAGLGGGDMAVLKSLLFRLRDRGTALVVIEHHMDLVMAVCDRIVVLQQGRMLASGPTAEIRNDPRVLEAYLGSDAE